MIWTSTLLIAFGIGYTQGHRLGQAAVLILVGIEIGLLVGGAMLMSNRHRREQKRNPDRDDP